MGSIPSTSIYEGTFDSPVGFVTVFANQNAVTNIVYEEQSEDLHINHESHQQSDLIVECIKQLTEYFAGKRTCFEIPIEILEHGFDSKVLIALQKIPCGFTTTYKEIAQNINYPKAYRAVGGAIHRNPIPIIIPCHRVIGSNNTLTGYAGGLWRKQILLGIEKPRTEKYGV